MIVVFDYDGTWTREPGVFRDLARVMLARGHTCVMLTGRSDEGRRGAEVRRAVGDVMPVVFAAGGWKREALERWMDQNMPEGGAHVVWIDDRPEYVGPQDPRRTIRRGAKRAERLPLGCPVLERTIMKGQVHRVGVRVKTGFDVDLAEWHKSRVSRLWHKKQTRRARRRQGAMICRAVTP